MKTLWVVKFVSGILHVILLRRNWARPVDSGLAGDIDEGTEGQQVGLLF